MGHQMLGRLPAAKNWRQVISLLAEGAQIPDLAAAAAKAAEASMIDASRDTGVKEAFWLLTQVPLAARQGGLVKNLGRLGLDLPQDPSLLDLVTATVTAVDNHIDRSGDRTDFGEMAQLSAAEALHSVMSRELTDLFGVSSARLREVLRGLATDSQFSSLCRDFFARLTRRHLSYFLHRELANHLGAGRRFPGLRDLQAFEEALELHCREATRIIQEFAGTWFGKHAHRGGIDKGKAGRFVHAAARKIRDELKARRSARA